MRGIKRGEGYVMGGIRWSGVGSVMGSEGFRYYGR